jgi:hypothetical protein
LYDVLTGFHSAEQCFFSSRRKKTNASSHHAMGPSQNLVFLSMRTLLLLQQLDSPLQALSLRRIHLARNKMHIDQSSSLQDQVEGKTKLLNIKLDPTDLPHTAEALPRFRGPSFDKKPLQSDNHKTNDIPGPLKAVGGSVGKEEPCID